MDLNTEGLTNVGLRAFALNLKLFGLGAFVLCQWDPSNSLTSPFFKFKEKEKPHHHHLDGIKEKSELPEATCLLQS